MGGLCCKKKAKKQNSIIETKNNFTLSSNVPNKNQFYEKLIDPQIDIEKNEKAKKPIIIEEKHKLNHYQSNIEEKNMINNYQPKLEEKHSLNQNQSNIEEKHSLNQSNIEENHTDIFDSSQNRLAFTTFKAKLPSIRTIKEEDEQENSFKGPVFTVSQLQRIEEDSEYESKNHEDKKQTDTKSNVTSDVHINETSEAKKEQNYSIKIDYEKTDNLNSEKTKNNNIYVKTNEEIEINIKKEVKQEKTEENTDNQPKNVMKDKKFLERLNKQKARGISQQLPNTFQSERIITLSRQLNNQLAKSDIQVSPSHGNDDFLLKPRIEIQVTPEAEDAINNKRVSKQVKKRPTKLSFMGGI